MTAVAIARPSPAVKPRILCVDDERNVLEALAANLRRAYDVVTATSGAEGLDLLASDPTIPVVISDMRMPQMNGASFLHRARDIAPDTVRMLLTGQADMATAIVAINHGYIFRFLTKPCDRDTLNTAIEAALKQHQLVTAERELLEQTLRGCVKTLVDVLALVSPAAFGRANRIKQRAVEIARALGITEAWQLEVAALLCQLGVVALPDEVCDKLQRGHLLSEAEQQMIARVPAITDQLLGNIPRIDAVRSILANHARPLPRTSTADPERKLIELGSHVLRVALDLDALESDRDAKASPLDVLRGRGNYDKEVLAAVERLEQGEGTPQEVREVPIKDLRPGMVLVEDLLMATGALLVTRGYEITQGFLERLNNFQAGAVRGPLRVTGG
jgi:CheY-like chemotaxis protein